MKQRLMELLKDLERFIPPRPGCHHAITFCRYGSDEHGWRDQLGLLVTRHGKEGMQTWFLDDGDLEKPGIQLAAEIMAEMEKAEPK